MKLCRLFDTIENTPEGIDETQLSAETYADPERIEKLVFEGIKGTEKKKRKKSGKRIIITLIAAVLIACLGIFGVGMAEMLFNMDEPITEEMRNDVLKEYALKKEDIYLERAKKQMEQPDTELPKVDIEAALNQYKSQMILDILTNHGYDTNGLNAEKISHGNTASKNSQFNIDQYQQFLDLCCDAMKNNQIDIKDKVRLELQLEEGLTRLFVFYYSSLDHKSADRMITELYKVTAGDHSIGQENIIEGDKISSLIKTRDRILDLISETAFSVDVRDSEAVEKFRQEAIAQGISEFKDEPLSDVWKQLYYVVLVTELKNMKNHANSEKYVYLQKKYHGFEDIRKSTEEAVKKDIEYFTGKPYDETNTMPAIVYTKEPFKLLPLTGIMQSVYLYGESNTRALKPYFSKVIDIMKKYGYNTNITYDKIYNEKKWFTPEYSDKFYSLLISVCEMTEKMNSKMTLEEKSTIGIFLNSAHTRLDFDTQCSQSYGSIMLEEYRFNNNIRNIDWSSEEYYSIQNEIQNEAHDINEKIRLRGNYGSFLIRRTLILINDDYYSRLSDFYS